MQEAPLWAEYTGQPEEEHRGWGWLEMVDPQDRAAARRIWEEAHGQGSAVDAEYRVHHAASGRYRWVHESGVPLKNPNGSIREWVGAVTDIHERRQAEERQRLLLNELNHRVKNTLAVVISIVRQTLRSSPGPDEAFARIQSRLQALSNTHDLLDATSWEGATIRDVLSAELRPYQGQGDGRLLMDGGPVVLDAKRALALGMIVHELATNAAKYGSLSTAEGRVEVRWRISGEDDGAQLDLTWQERDGPPVAAPGAGGFGSSLIERSVTGDLAGEIGIGVQRKRLLLARLLPAARRCGCERADRRRVRSGLRAVVIAGARPAIQSMRAALTRRSGTDARIKSGHDDND